MNDRIEGLRERLEEPLLVTNLVNVRYLTGFRSTNVAVVVEEEHPEDPDLFGLWEGGGLEPDKITIYRLPLEDSFPDPDEHRAEIRITVLHELAHYFGIDESRVDELGYG